MESRPVELILAHNLSEHLSSPVLLLDGGGSLIFFNEPAEPILGMRYEDVGELSAGEWVSHLQPVSEAGEAISPRDLPVLRAVAERHPAYHVLRLRLADGPVEAFEATWLPLVARDERYLGAMIVFWRTDGGSGGRQ